MHHSGSVLYYFSFNFTIEQEMMDKVLLIPKETTEKFIQLQFKDAKPLVKC